MRFQTDPRPRARPDPDRVLFYYDVDRARAVAVRLVPRRGPLRAAPRAAAIDGRMMRSLATKV